MRMADALKDNPMRFVITNVITMDVEITKSDLKTIVSKNTQDNRFNAFKNKVAQDIHGFLEKSVYEGWREVIPGKHPETAYFAYFSRELGDKAYLCVRKIKNTGLFKPICVIPIFALDLCREESAARLHGSHRVSTPTTSAPGWSRKVSPTTWWIRSVCTILRLPKA